MVDALHIVPFCEVHHNQGFAITQGMEPALGLFHDSMGYCYVQPPARSIPWVCHDFWFGTLIRQDGSMELAELIAQHHG